MSRSAQSTLLHLDGMPCTAEYSLDGDAIEIHAVLLFNCTNPHRAMSAYVPANTFAGWQLAKWENDIKEERAQVAA